MEAWNYRKLVITASMNTRNSSARFDHSVTAFLHRILTVKKIPPTA